MIEPINVDEWRAAFDEAIGCDADPSSMTCVELAAQFGITLSPMRTRLAKLVKAGKVTTTKKRITDSAGRTQVVTAYLLKK